MSQTRAEDPFRGLTRLNASAYLREPLPSSSTRLSAIANHLNEVHDPQIPDTILLFPWLNASKRHIAKYLSGYSTIYPRARIVVVTTDGADLMYRTSVTQIRQLAPIVDVVRANPDGKVMVHLFSNGGAYKASQFLRALEKVTNARGAGAGARVGVGADSMTHGHPSVHATIFDSGPGRPTFKTALAAFSVGLPRPWYLRLPSMVLIYIGLAIMWLLTEPLKRKNAIETAREDLNNPRFITLQAPRCYMYTDTDTLVAPEDVEAHALDAEQKGFVTFREMFKNSTHAGHIRVDETRYWNAIRKTWQVGLSAGDKEDMGET